MKRHFIAINSHRSSTDHGFANTWQVYECESHEQRASILADGLPVRDVETLDSNGCRGPVYSTKGIRAATPAELREVRRLRERYHEDPEPVATVLRGFTRAAPCAPECFYCGEAAHITEAGVSHHGTPDEIDHEADADHVALVDGATAWLTTEENAS